MLDRSSGDLCSYFAKELFPYIKDNASLPYDDLPVEHKTPMEINIFVFKLSVIMPIIFLQIKTVHGP